MAMAVPLVQLPPIVKNVPKLLAATGIAVAVITSCNPPRLVGASSGFASTSVSAPRITTSDMIQEASTGMEFPSAIHSDGGELELAGTGLRKKSVLGLKNIIVYTFGIYFNREKLRVAKKVVELPEVLTSDMEMTARLIIVYSRLKVGSVRGAFEESIGGRIKKFTGSENKELLQSFTGLFRDDILLPKGTIIDLVRLPEHVLRTEINGREIGSVKSELLCRCVFDLYVGDQPFDVAGRDAIAAGLASLQKQ